MSIVKLNQETAEAIRLKEAEAIINKIDAETRDKLLNTLGNQKYSIGFNQDHIIIRTKNEGDRTGFDYTPFMASILEYMIDEGMNITPLPEVKIKTAQEKTTNSVCPISG